MNVLLLFIASRDWETVQNVVPGNSSSKPDQLCSERKGDEQSLKLLNYSDLLFIYSFIYLIYLFTCIYSKSLIPVRRQSRVNVKCICLRHETVLLLSMSCD